MHFFKRILLSTEKPVAPEKRQGGQRLVVAAEFPLRVGLGFDAAAVVDRDRWNWKCRMLNCSEPGVRLEVGAAVAAVTGAPCNLKLDLEGFELEVPCLVSNLRRQGERMFLGLKQVITDAATLAAYRQFLEIVALGNTLRLHLRRSQPAAAEYQVEQYVSARRSCLNLWRSPATGIVTGAEFSLKDCLVRVMPGHPLEYYAGTDAATAPRATPEQALEIHRLFKWVVPNLSLSVPEDVRKFLAKHSA
ncbi:MAG: hypothetical protein PSU94_10210 [Lacunisphaera sp.]|nr:hypothetical protein [Lacunisphaera sp.]